MFEFPSPLNLFCILIATIPRFFYFSTPFLSNRISQKRLFEIRLTIRVYPSRYKIHALIPDERGKISLLRPKESRVSIPDRRAGMGRISRKNRFPPIPPHNMNNFRYRASVAFLYGSVTYRFLPNRPLITPARTNTSCSVSVSYTHLDV